MSESIEWGKTHCPWCEKPYDAKGNCGNACSVRLNFGDFWDRLITVLRERDAALARVRELEAELGKAKLTLAVIEYLESQS